MDSLVEKELQDELRPEVKNIFRKIFRLKYISWLRKPIAFILITESLLGIFAIKTGLVTLHFDILKKSAITLSGVQQIGIINTNQNNVLSAQSQCPFKYCSDFKDGKWKDFDQFIVIQNDPLLILKSPNNPRKPGATMYYEQDVGNFTSEFFVTPMASVSANLAFAYGNLTRCIIGDGNYQSISCQINEDYPKAPKDWTYFDKEGKLHGKISQWQLSKFEPNRELQLRFEFQKIEENESIIIKINDQAPLIWKLPKKFQRLVKLDKVGISLFTTNYDDVQAVFKQFRLDPHL